MEKVINKNQYNMLASRAGFNSALRHFKTSLGFSNDIDEGYNLADVLNECLDNKEIEERKIKPIVNILLKDKFGYTYSSQNLKKKVADISKLKETVSQWNNIQYIAAYYNSSGILNLINPCNSEHWDMVLPLSEDELLICFAGSIVDVEEKVLKSAVNDFFTLLYGGKVKEKVGYKNASAEKMVLEKEAVVEAPDQKEEPTAVSDQQIVTGRQNMSAKISIVVTNELFHNGNVEAWKRIIESYKASHSGCEVHIWYDGEKINDINALFKWGKVKHGNPILFSVAGEVIKDISKLKKYLFEGASPRFEAFLHGHPGTVLELF